MIRKFLLFLTLLAVFSNASFAQFEAKKVPRSQRKNPILLSRYLCQGQTNDSAKVIAISSWIAANIKYDYRALISGEWKLTSNNLLLKKKKGLCGDFANLFNELCSYQGINSQSVLGYTKTINYEPYDSLIMAEHMWNVVFVDGKWRPIDLSWSVGYIKRRKQWIRKKMFLIFGIPFRYKYKFVRELNDSYVLLDPKIFMRTHAPLQPYWQLLNNPVPMKTFEANRVKEYLVQHDSMHYKSYDYKNEIKNFQALSKKDQFLIGPKQAFKYNPQNHRILGLGYYNFSQQLLQELNVTDVEEQQIKQLDSCAIILDSSIFFYNAFKNDLKRERKRRRFRNATFKGELLDTNKLFIKKIKFTRKILRKRNYLCKSNINKLKGQRKKVVRLMNENKEQDIERVNRTTKSGAIKDSKIASYTFELKEIDSIIDIRNKIDFTNDYDAIKSSADYIVKGHSVLRSNFYRTRDFSFNAKENRFNYDEYSRVFLDPLKQAIGNTADTNHKQFDSLNTQFDNIINNRLNIIAHHDSISNLLKAKLKLFKKLKKNNVNDLNEDLLYVESLNKLVEKCTQSIALYDSLIRQNKLQLQQLEEYNKPLNKTIRLLKKEIKIEYKRYRFKNSIYQHLYIKYKRQADGLRLASKKGKRYCAKRVSYLEKQIAKRDKELETE